MDKLWSKCQRENEKQIAKIKQVSVGPLIGAAIKRINENRPVSPLFNERFKQEGEAN